MSSEGQDRGRGRYRNRWRDVSRVKRGRREQGGVERGGERGEQGESREASRASRVGGEEWRVSRDRWVEQDRYREVSRVIQDGGWS